MKPNALDKISRRFFLGQGMSMPLAIAPLLTNLSRFAKAADKPHQAYAVIRSDGPTIESLLPARNPHADTDTAELLKLVSPDLVYHPPRPRPERNVWPIWMEARRAYVEYEAQDHPLITALLHGQPVASNRALSRVRNWLKQNERALSVLHTGDSYKAVSYPVSGGSISPLWCEALPAVRKLGWLRSAASAVASHDQDPQRAFAEANGELAMGKILLEAENGIWGHLLAAGITGSGCASIRQAATRARVPKSLIVDSIAALEGAYPRTDQLKRAFRREFTESFVPLVAYCRADASIADLVTTFEFGGGNPHHPVSKAHQEQIRERARQIAILLDRHPTPLNRSATVQLASTVQSELLNALDLLPASRSYPKIDALQKELRDWPASLRRDLNGVGHAPLTDAQLRQRSESIRAVENPLGKLLVLQYFAVFRSVECATSEATTKAYQLMLAILLHEQRHKSLPSTLEQLVAEGILPKVPIDPFAGINFGYDPERGVIWSVGRDGKNRGELPDVRLATDLTWRVGSPFRAN